MLDRTGNTRLTREDRPRSFVGESPDAQEDPKMADVGQRVRYAGVHVLRQQVQHVRHEHHGHC